jgi:hypothetical protein
MQAGTRTATVTITDNAGGVSGSTQTIAVTGTGLSNTVPVSVNFGPYGNLGAPSSASGGSLYGSEYDVMFVTVTVCVPGTTTCVNIPNVQVDTGSVGLRVFASQLGSVTLPSISNTTAFGGSTGNITGTVYECNEFLDSYTWGPVDMATVQIGGETASQIPAASGGTANSGIPIQVITDNGAAPSGAPCVQAGLANTNTPAIFGANGIIGIRGGGAGATVQDCGSSCESYTSDDLYALYDSSNESYYYASVPVSQQVWNPVAAFSSADTNGVVVTLQSIVTPPSPDVGAATATGTLTFGINTEPNNQIPGTAKVYQLDENGYFGSSTFGGVTYTSQNSGGTVLDTGTYEYSVSDDATLSTVLGTSVTDCTLGTTDIGYFCPSSTLSIPLQVAGTNGTSTTINLSIANALNLFDANPTFAAFDNLGGPSCFPTSTESCSTATDMWLIGLPFYFGKTIYFGNVGTTVGGVTSTYGYYAF